MAERRGCPEATSHAHMHAHMHDTFIRCNYNATLKKSEDANYNATLKKSEDALQELRTEKSSKETFG